MKTMKYCVCVDYGHGETTATAIDLESGEQLRLNILPAGNDEGKKVESCICKDEDGQWRFVREDKDCTLPGFQMYFKGEIDLLNDEKKEAFGIFIQLVFDAILKNNSDILSYNAQTKERNFDYCIACPSAWGEDNEIGKNGVIDRYKSFFNKVLPFPVKWVIRESDAAFFKFIDRIEHDMLDRKDDDILVCDIGSSTIDFTYYGKNKNRLPKGGPYGASRVEMAVFNDCKKSDSYQNADRILSKELEQIEDRHINRELVLLHFIKRQKEDFYTKKPTDLYLDVSSKKILPTSKAGRLFDDIWISREQLDLILGGYKEKLRESFNKLVLAGANPGLVILTGGASRMPWVRILLEKAFPKSKVVCDSNPSYVVSDGMAYYAYAENQMRLMFASVRSEVELQFTNEIIGLILQQEFNSSLMDIWLPGVKKICDSFASGTLKDEHGVINVNALLLAMSKHNEVVFGAEQAEITSAKISKSLSDKINSLFSAKIREAFINNFKMEPPFSTNLDLELRINASGIDGKEADQTEATAAGNKAFVVLTWDDWKKDRSTDPNDRRKYADKFYEGKSQSSIILIPEALEPLVSDCTSKIDSFMDHLSQKGPFIIYT